MGRAPPEPVDLSDDQHDLGRELFAGSAPTPPEPSRARAFATPNPTGTTTSTPHVAPVHDHFALATGMRHEQTERSGRHARWAGDSGPRHRRSGAGGALAKALVAGGVRVLEVTLRTPVALAAIRAMADEVPEAIVGVGTSPGPRTLPRRGMRALVLSQPRPDAGVDCSSAAEWFATVARRHDALRCDRGPSSRI